MSHSDPEIIVVGGGPAGSAAAARLASFGHRVLLLDRDLFPRPKPCGDCVNPAAVRELAELGVLEALRALPHASLQGWTVTPQSGKAFGGSFPPVLGGMAIGREWLDRTLLDHAASMGAEVRTGVRVVDLLRRGSGVVEGVILPGGESIRSALVIGADGLRSVVVRRLGLLRRGPLLRKLALTGRVRGLGGLDCRGELHLLPWGTLGIAPIGGGVANVTVVVGGREAARVAGAREEYYDHLLATVPRLRGGLRDEAVLATGPFDWPTRSAVADGALLVGDAAGYYDPFTGQGIFRALSGARLAAAAAHDAVTSGDVSALRLRRYDRARRGAFRSGQRLQRVIEQFISRPRAMSAAGRLLRQRPQLADTLVAVTGDLLPVRALWAARTLASLIA